MQLYKKVTEFVRDKQVFCGIDVHAEAMDVRLFLCW